MERELPKLSFSFLLGLAFVFCIGLLQIYSFYCGQCKSLNVSKLLPDNSISSQSRLDKTYSIYPNIRLTIENEYKEKNIWLLASMPDDAYFQRGSINDSVDRQAQEIAPEQGYRLLKLEGSDAIYTYRSGSKPIKAKIAKAFLVPQNYNKSQVIEELSRTENKRSLFIGLTYCLLALFGLFSVYTSSGIKFLGLLIILTSIAGFYLPSSNNVLTSGLKIADNDLLTFKTEASYFDKYGDEFINSFPKAQEGSAIYETNQLAGNLQFDVFAKDSEQTYSQPQRSIFGGWFAAIQALEAQKIHRLFYAVAIIIVLTCILSYILAAASKFFFLVCAASAASVSIIASIYYSIGWDELFINLRHSYIWANYGSYSYNFSQHAEATVDFIPFFLAGILGKLGLPLIDSILSITLFGNLLVMQATYLIANAVCKNKYFSISLASLIAIFPCLLLVAGTGFTATFFSGWALLGLYYFFLAPRQKFKIGIVLLATLTLVRTEGILLAALAFLVKIILFDLKNLFSKDCKQSLIINFKIGILLIAPFLISCVIRYFYFGYPLPNPITFKNAKGDYGYLLQGLSLFKQGISAFHLDLIAIAFILSLLTAPKSEIKKPLLAIIVSLFPFTLSYYSGGGDWFPLEWNRYMMPFTLGLWILTSLLIFNSGKYYLGRYCMLAFLPLCLTFYDSLYLRDGTAFWGKHLSWVESSKERWGRVQVLASFGLFLKDSTAPDVVVASPEMSTLMYFSERNLLDLLGIANPEIAFTKLQPMTPGDLMHRKRNPQTIAKNLPGVVALFEMAHMQPNDVFKNGDGEASTLIQALAFSDFQIKVAYYRVGSYQHLVDVGYRPIAIFYKNTIYNYYIHESAYKDHISRLENLGFVSKGKASITYKYPAEIVSRFSPS